MDYLTGIESAIKSMWRDIVGCTGLINSDNFSVSAVTWRQHNGCATMLPGHHEPPTRWWHPARQRSRE